MPAWVAITKTTLSLLVLVQTVGLDALGSEPPSWSLVRLDDPGKSMEHVPVRSQGSLGSCNWEATVQMADAYRFSHNDTRTDLVTSALIASVTEASNSSISFNINILPTEDNCAKVRKLASYGGCDSSALRKSFGKTEEEYMEEIIGWTAEMTAAFSPLSLSFGDIIYWLSGQTNPSHVRRNEKLRKYALGVCQTLREDGGDARPLPSIDFIEENLKSYAPVKLMDEMRKRFCSGKNKIQMQLGRCEHFSVRRSSVLDSERFIASKLDMPNAQPIGIGFCGFLMIHGKSFRGIDAFGSFTKACGGHSALIIGKRPNPKTGAPEFLVRNSWGTSCSGYSPDWSCEKGSLWIDANALVRNMDDISYIE